MIKIYRREDLNVKINNDINSFDMLKENLYSLYKWQYLYFKIKENKNYVFNKRYQNILLLLTKKLNILIDLISESLLGTYNNWLEFHAILTPNTWASKRLEQIFELNDSKIEALDSIVHDMYHLYYNNGRYEIEKCYELLNDEVLRDEKVLPSFSEYLMASAQDEIQNYEDSNNEDSLEMWKKYLDEEDYKSIFEYICEMYSFELQTMWINILEYMENNGDVNVVFMSICANIYFKIWFNVWEAQGIEDTRERIEGIYKQLQNINTFDIIKKIEVINIALNAAHQTGSMLDYVQEKYDIDKEYLDYLSNIPQTEIDEWEKELKLELNENKKYLVK